MSDDVRNADVTTALSPRAPPKSDAPLAVTILGAGRVVSDYYLPALRATRIASSVTIVDPDAASLAASAKAHPQARLVQADLAGYFATAGDARDTTRDLAIVALPNQFHVEACERALASGAHVLCEKPLSLRADDCARLDAAARAAGDVLNVAMVRRYLPSWTLARRILQGGEIGRLRAIEARDCTPFGWRPRSFAFFAPEAGGVLADMGVHYLDFLEWTLGPLTPVSWRDDWRGGSESSCTFGLTAGDVKVALVLSRLVPGGDSIRFVGERGVLTVMKREECKLRVVLRGEPERIIEAPRPFASGPWPADLRGAFCEMLVDQQRAMRGEAHGAADAADSRSTVALIEWAYGQRPVPAPARAADARPVVVTGGTGFIGGKLVARLDEAGERLRCAVRSPATVANLARHRLEFAPTNLLSREDVTRLVAGARVIYHLAYGTGGPDATAVTIDGTKNVVEAAVAAGVETVVVTSTAYVYGLPENGLVDETFPYAPYGGEYGESKAAMEKWCLARAQTSGATRIVVLNPTNVFGPGGGAYTTLPVTLAAQDSFAWIDDGQGFCNYTYVENTVDALLAAAATPQAHGRRYIVTDGVMSWKAFFTPLLAPLIVDVRSYPLEGFRARARAEAAFSWRNLLRAIVAAQPVRDAARRSPLFRLLASAQFADAIVHPAAAGGPADLLPPAPTLDPPPAWLADLFHARRTVFSAQKAADELGWRPRVSVAEAQAATIAWLRATGHYERPAEPPSWGRA